MSNKLLFRLAVLVTAIGIRLEVLGDERADGRGRTPRNRLESGMFKVWEQGGRFHTTGMFLLREEVSRIGEDPYGG